MFGFYPALPTHLSHYDVPLFWGKTFKSAVKNEEYKHGFYEVKTWTVFNTSNHIWDQLEGSGSLCCDYTDAVTDEPEQMSH